MDQKKRVSKQPNFISGQLCRRLLLILMGGIFLPALFLTFVAAEKAQEAGKMAPSVTAESAILIESNSGKVLYEKNADEKMFPASTTKILTALIAIEAGDLSRKVKVSTNAAIQEGSSIYLEAGERIPMRDLIYGLMLRSGNDAAVAIAEEIAGNTEKFAVKMNQRAKTIGAVNSNFQNPNGLHNQEHYTTAADMALIAREAMSNQNFETVAATKSWVADRGEGKYNYFYNKNKVIYQYDGGTGIKIGYTKVAGRCLVASSTRDGMELICVVFNAPDWFNDTYQLMNYGYDNYDLIRIAKAEEPLKKVWVADADRFVFIGPEKDVVCPSLKETESSISIEYQMNPNIQAPVSRWQKVGELKVSQGGQFIYSEPLYFLEDTE